MHPQLKNPKLYLMILSDAFLFALAYIVACLFRFEFNLKAADIQPIFPVLLWMIPLKLSVFFSFGLYHGMWRYTGISDFWNLVKASLFATLSTMAIILYLYRFQGYSRAIFLMDGVLSFLFTGGLRIAICTTLPLLSRREWAHLSPDHKKSCKRVLIIGAGSAGEKILREIMDNHQLNYEVAGFLDDDPEKRGRSIHGVMVLGPLEKLPVIMEKGDIRDVLIAMPSASGDQMRHIVDICKYCGASYKTLPEIGAIIDGRVSIKKLRDVSYEDLLGRPAVQLDVENIRQYVEGRTVLITGCGGSIGSELSRQVIRFQPKLIILLDASETNLFQIEMEFRHELDFSRSVAILGHVQDRSLMGAIFKKYSPHTVFHAAAYKHVPMLEKNPWEAVFNNIQGSQVVMEMALEHAVERFVLVSTDKAVRPTNVMGASKRITELLMQSLQGNGTRFMAVRFGNVVGSSGSVIPLFRRQIEQGGPVKVTHPDVTRYFMTIPEAAQLIIQAGALGKGGEIFILEMGTPVKIAEMARDLIRLSGKEPDSGIEIIYTGLREGEKLYEELVTEGENIVPTGHAKITALRSGNLQGFGTHLEMKNWLYGKIEQLEGAALRRDGRSIKKKLQEIAPEYSPQDAGSVL
jgi:FlaA1/EpsC-like NDP-sugar epimerase